MTAIGRFVVTSFLGALGVWSVAGCREKTPAPSHNYDLSEDGVALLPTGSPTKNASYANVQNNRADWVALRDPGDLADVPSAKAAPAEKPGEVSGELATELNDIIKDYNEVVAEGEVEGMLDYFVEEQQEVAERYINAATSLGGAVAKLRESLPASDDDANAPIAALLDRLTLASSLTLTIDSMKTSGQDNVTARMVAKAGIAPSFEALEFVLVDDEWYFRIASPATVEGWAASAEQAIKDATSLLDAAKDEAGDTDELLSKLQEAVKGLLAEEAQPANERDAPPEPGDTGEPVPDADDESDDGANSDEDDDDDGGGDE